MTETTIDADATYPVARTADLSETVVETVADAEGVDPTELTPLYTAIEPDALDSLFRPQLRQDVPDVTAEIRFDYHGYEVRVTAAGRVTLDAD